MAQPVRQQHPAVVLRAHYVHLRVLLVVALIALVAMAAAVVVLATSDGSAGSAGSASSPAPVTAPGPSGSTRYDGGPEEGTRGTVTPPGSNYEGPH
jgi:hypothetical protein